MTIRPLCSRAVLALAAAAVVSSVVPTGADQTRSLYERLGGLPRIAVVVSDFVDVLAGDATLNANPAIDAARKRTPAPYLKYHVTAMMCQAAGGPCQYHGRSLKESHAALNITEREWARMIELLKQVLARHQLPSREAQELLDLVASTKAEIVVSPQV